MGQAVQQERGDAQQQNPVSPSCDPADLMNSPVDLTESTEVFSVSSIGRCKCIGCLGIGSRTYSPLYCRVSDEFKKFCDHSRIVYIYEKKHFYYEGKYKCDSCGCKSSFKRWDDLVRHFRNTHCLNPERFPCPEIGCKYSGPNGFVRKDKLKSHYKNVHEGKPRFAQGGAPRSIQPAVGPSTLTLSDGKFTEAQGQGMDGREAKRVRRA